MTIEDWKVGYWYVILSGAPFGGGLKSQQFLNENHLKELQDVEKFRPGTLLVYKTLKEAE